MEDAAVDVANQLITNLAKKYKEIDIEVDNFDVDYRGDHGDSNYIDDKLELFVSQYVKMKEVASVAITALHILQKEMNKEKENTNAGKCGEGLEIDDLTVNWDEL